MTNKGKNKKKPYNNNNIHLNQSTWIIFLIFHIISFIFHSIMYQGTHFVQKLKICFLNLQAVSDIGTFKQVLLSHV